MKKPLNSMANIAERIVLYVHYLICLLYTSDAADD